jgi:hypothetical protein
MLALKRRFPSAYATRHRQLGDYGQSTAWHRKCGDNEGVFKTWSRSRQKNMETAIDHDLWRRRWIIKKRYSDMRQSQTTDACQTKICKVGKQTELGCGAQGVGSIERTGGSITTSVNVCLMTNEGRLLTSAKHKHGPR